MLPPPLNEVSLTMPMVRSNPLSANASFNNETDIKPLWQIEKQAIEAAIAFCDDNVPKAAALLEVSASTIYRKRERWAEGKA